MKERFMCAPRSYNYDELETAKHCQWRKYEAGMSYCQSEGRCVCDFRRSMRIIHSDDYRKALDLDIPGVGDNETDRWAEGVDHHPMSARLMAFLADHDFNDYRDYFCWKTGGDGDNGETLMYELDAFFEYLDKERS